MGVLKMKKAELCATLFLAAVLLLMASCAMYYIENPSQPASFSSIPATMWWTVTALTTVGYGDIYPRTACGKILGSCVAFFGIGLFALPAGIISSGFVEVIEEKHQAECDELADMIGEDGTYLQELRDEVSPPLHPPSLVSQSTTCCSLIWTVDPYFSQCAASMEAVAPKAQQDPHCP